MERPHPTATPGTRTGTRAAEGSGAGEPTLEQRLAVLESLWRNLNEIYPALESKGIRGRDWIEPAVERVKAVRSDQEFYDLLLEQMARLGDTHTRIASHPGQPALETPPVICVRGVIPPSRSPRNGFSRTRASHRGYSPSSSGAGTMEHEALSLKRLTRPAAQRCMSLSRRGSFPCSDSFAPVLPPKSPCGVCHPLIASRRVHCGQGRLASVQGKGIGAREWAERFGRRRPPRGAAAGDCDSRLGDSVPRLRPTERAEVGLYEPA